MATDKGPVATEAPPFPSAALESSGPVSVESLTADAARATQSLKRHREGTPNSPSSAAALQIDPDLSPSKVARLAGLTSRHTPAPLTGAAAAEDERRRQEEHYKLQVSGASDNPAYKVQEELMSAGALAMSRPQDAPMGGEAQTATAAPATLPTPVAADSEPKTDVSPQSATSLATLATVDAPVTDSPGPMDVDGRNERAGFGTQPAAQMEEKGVTSLSYPGLVQSTPNMSAPPPRGMSMPMTGTQDATRSPNSKKHKCPYCETGFTRHHNLKSHLLTHSQEKPYVCQTCQLRFRRLHDLKRHSKLHTGEKPHVCPKCDRKFARGDALARHSKGPGGCVGRRSSMGSSFLGDEDLEGTSQLEGDSAMTDVVYDGANEVDMTEEDRRRLSMSGMKSQHVQGTNTGRIYSPNVDRVSGGPNAAHTADTSISSIALGSGNASMYAQRNLTESPKPISPGAHGDAAAINRQHSPSLSTQFQAPHFGRQSDRQTSPATSGFAAADAARYAASAATAQNNAQNLSSAVGQHTGVSGAIQPQATSAASQNGGSGDSTSNNLFATDQGVWAYIHSLEEKVRQLSERMLAMEASSKGQEDRILYLTDEVAGLRNQDEPKADITERIS